LLSKTNPYKYIHLNDANTNVTAVYSQNDSGTKKDEIVDSSTCEKNNAEGAGYFSGCPT